MVFMQREKGRGKSTGTVPGGVQFWWGGLGACVAEHWRVHQLRY